jgi:hypothetical protein
MAASASEEAATSGVFCSLQIRLLSAITQSSNDIHTTRSKRNSNYYDSNNRSSMYCVSEQTKVRLHYPNGLVHWYSTMLHNEPKTHASSSHGVDLDVMPQMLPHEFAVDGAKR